MAPEIRLLGAAPSFMTDIYSYGGILEELVNHSSTDDWDSRSAENGMDHFEADPLHSQFSKVSRC